MSRLKSWDGAGGRRAKGRQVGVLILGCWLAVLLGACQPGSAGTKVNNPLRPVDGADPWLVFHDGNYYLTTTQVTSIRMWKSPTLAGLAQVAPVTIWSDQTPSRCCNVWAPEFHRLEGPDGPRWYVYYSAGTDGTLDNQRMHVLESSGDDPLGPYTYKGRIFDPENDTWAIDGSVLQMPDGALYYLFSSWVGDNQNMFIAPMSNPWTISGRRVLLSTPTHDWEKSVANVNEGPEVLQHGGKTFIIYSASACWGPDYKLGMLVYTGGDVLDPKSWRKHPEPVFQRSDAQDVYGPGHNGFFTSPDGKEHWIVYHANAAASDGCTGSRTTRVQKFTWNEDGTPNFGTPVSLETILAPPSGERGATPAPATIPYLLVSREGDQCLAPAANGDPVRSATCEAEQQQWNVEYLGNTYYRLADREPSGGSGTVLAVSDDEAAPKDGAAVEQEAWAYSADQQWRLLPAADGWVRIEARHGGKYLESGNCEADSGEDAHVWSRRDSNCQLFRLQPVAEVKLINANSNKPLAIERDSMNDGAPVVLASDSESEAQRWSFVHQDSSFYQIRASHSQKCLAVMGDVAANGSDVGQLPCDGSHGQQWRIQPLEHGAVRLLARASGKVLDVINCRMTDGTKVQQWAWMNNDCQRFRLMPD